MNVALCLLGAVMLFPGGQAGHFDAGNQHCLVEKTAQDNAVRTEKSFSIYTLSRGRGVPPDAKRALQQTRDILSELRATGIVFEATETRIGLEGELRLCVAFSDRAEANEAWLKIKAVTDAIDLVNIEFGDCDN